METSQLLARLYKYTDQSQRDMKLATLYSFLNKLFDIAPELLIGVAVDLVVRKQDSLIASFGLQSPMEQLGVLALLTFSIWSFESLFQYLYSVKWKNIAQKLQHILRLDSYKHLQSLDMSWLEKNRIGNLQTVINDDINQLERFIDTGLNDIIQILSSTVLIGAIFFYLQPLLASCSLFPIPFIIWGVWFFRKQIEPRYTKVRECAGVLGSRIQSNILGMSVIKSYGAEDYQLAKLMVDSRQYQEANKSAIRVSSAFIPVIRVVILAGFLITLIGGGWMTISGTLPVGSYSAMVFLTQRFLWPFTHLGQMIDNFSRAQASAKRVFQLLDTPSEITTKLSFSPMDKPTRGEITFQKVSFAYQEKPILKKIQMKIPTGSRVALVGSSGGGKSTLVKLLIRFYDPIEGHITLDGKPIKDLSLQDLRDQISYVSQDAIIFPGTVSENIAFGCSHPQQEKIERAAQMASLHRFISRDLEKGYETQLGERGQKLSGGQRQRLSIARAIYRDAPVVVFDEATSAVDNETEIMILGALENWLRQRTTIMIAHRLSTVVQCDQIYVIEEGNIVEQGTHQELVKKHSSKYSRLWKLQTGQWG